MRLYGWQLGLKTSTYYLRTKAAVDAIKLTVGFRDPAGFAADGRAETFACGGQLETKHGRIDMLDSL
eukprot:7571332-Heterocapsa_arctica.AAC.1